MKYFSLILTGVSEAQQITHDVESKEGRQESSQASGKRDI